MVLTLAAALACPPVHRWHFEGFLSLKATELADGRRASVHCNTVFDTLLLALRPSPVNATRVRGFSSMKFFSILT